MENRKITILTASDYPYGGAAENFVRMMSLGLKRNHADVQVVRYRGRKYRSINDTDIDVSNYLFKKLAKSKIHNIIQQFFIVLNTPFFFLKRRFIYHDKIMILYGLEFSTLIRPIKFWCDLLGMKVYRVITDHYARISNNGGIFKKFQYRAYQKQFKKIDPTLDGVIVVSHYLRRKCITDGVSEGNIILIPHFIEIEEMVINDRTFDQITLAYAGTLSEANGIYVLLDAFKYLSSKRSNLKLLVMGKMRDELKLFLQRSEYSDLNIEFTGFLEKNEIKEKLSNSDILINPRRSGTLAQAGFPTKLGEYFATGKPVVSTAVGDIPAYFTDREQLVLAKPDDAHSLADAIDYLIETPEKANEIGKKGFMWGKNNLNYIENSQKLIQFINR